MELKLYDAEVKLRAKVPTDEAPPALAAPRVVVVLPASGDGPEKNKERPLPCKLHVAIPNGGEEASEALEQPIVLKVFDGRQVLVSRGLTLKECIPVLSDGAITWSQEISRKGTDAVLDVSIQVKTDRRPRLLINQAILMKRRALEVAHQLSLHKNKVVVGLVPPVLGCLVGIVATSPVWLPLTLLVGIMGAPVWFVVAVAGSLVLVFAVLSTVVTVKAVRSARLKAAVTQFLRSPQGQLLLFEGAATEQGMSPSQLAARIQQHVMENPSSKLMASLAIDFLGNATFVVPVLGELADVLWAPVSAKLVSGMYSESSPHAKYLAFFEELLPFTDFIPTATLAWMKENLSSPELEKLMRLVRPSAATA